MNKTITRQSSIIEIMSFIKKFGASFSIIDKNTIEVTMKSGNTKIYYLNDGGDIYATSEFANEKEEL